MTKAIKNVLLYYRVSTNEQVLGYSIDNQKRELHRYCEAMGYTIINEYEDLGITGTSIEKREGFKALLREISNDPNVDAVVIWKLSRISRKMLDLLNILEFFEKYDITLITKEDGINTSTAFGKSTLKLVGVFAEMERENIIAQTTAGMRERARQGNWNGGVAPIGYNSIDGKLAIDDNNAETVKLIFDFYTNKNWGYSRICKYLNSNLDKYPTKKGAQWSYATIKQVLDNPTYAGYIRWGRFKDWAKKRRKGSDEDYILEKGNHQAIIYEELWERTKDKRKEKSVTNEKTHNFNYLLSGLLKCPECGASMVSHRSSKVNSKGEKVWYRYYVCNQWSNKKAVCSPNLIKAEEIEKLVIERISQFVNSPNLADILAKKIGQSNNISELEEQLNNINKELQKLNKDEDTYYSYLTNEEKLKVLKEEKILKLISDIGTKINEKEGEKALLIARIQNTKNNALDLTKIKMILQNFNTVFSKSTPEQQKDLLHSLIKEIKVKKIDSKPFIESISLNFDANIISKKNDPKEFEVTYDTVHYK